MDEEASSNAQLEGSAVTDTTLGSVAPSSQEASASPLPSAPIRALPTEI